MTPMIKCTALTIAMAFPFGALAEPLALTPADPQPSAADLTPGLAVKYAFPSDVRTIADAKEALEMRSKDGDALRGLSYDDNSDGDPTLTAMLATKVAADISGYMKFDAPGLYTLNVFSNDGIEMQLGGQEVAFYDEIHACGPAGEVEVEVPEAGFYALEATYFQRKGTACLMLEMMAEGGKMAVADDALFMH